MCVQESLRDCGTDGSVQLRQSEATSQSSSSAAKHLSWTKKPCANEMGFIQPRQASCFSQRSFARHKNMQWLCCIWQTATTELAQDAQWFPFGFSFYEKQQIYYFAWTTVLNGNNNIKITNVKVCFKKSVGTKSITPMMTLPSTCSYFLLLFLQPW